MDKTRSSLLRRLHDWRDRDSWNEFVTLYEPVLFKYARSHRLSEDDARDVVQNVFTALIRSMSNFKLDRTRGRFRTWLWRVTQNAIADWARRRRRRSTAEEEWRQREKMLRDSLRSESSEEWESSFRQRVLEYSLERVRVRTKPNTWSCFEKHVIQRCAGADVAQELGVNVNAVYANASRVLTRVRNQCSEYIDDPEGIAFE